jgi:hypothetical protein
MHTSLYYPHTKIQTMNLIKTALLLWDRVEYICPKEFVPAPYEDKLMAEAAELITQQHIPSVAEKIETHKVVERLLSKPLPAWFLFEPESPIPPYQILPGKFHDETWRALREQGYAELNPTPVPGYDFTDYMLHPSLGYTLMSILADVCAGKEKQTITDQSDSYAALTRFFTQDAGGQYGDVELADSVESECERLVTVSLGIIDVQGVPLNKLIQLRKREEKESGKGTFLRSLREKYFSELDSYVKRLHGATRESDKHEIERQFEQSMAGDLNNLRKELKDEAVNVIVSKEFLGAMAVTFGAVVEPVTTSLISSALLAKAARDYVDEKRTKYTGHAMSWLYMLNPSRIYG